MKIKDIGMIIMVLAGDFGRFILELVSKPFIYVYTLNFIHKFIWYWVLLLTKGETTYNRAADYDEKSVNIVKKFISELKEAIDDDSYMLNEHYLGLNRDKRVWIENRWYASRVYYYGNVTIIPRRSELFTIISLYNKAKKKGLKGNF